MVRSQPEKPRRSPRRARKPEKHQRKKPSSRRRARRVARSQRRRPTSWTARNPMVRSQPRRVAKARREERDPTMRDLTPMERSQRESKRVATTMVRSQPEKPKTSPRTKRRRPRKPRRHQRRRPSSRERAERATRSQRRRPTSWTARNPMVRSQPRRVAKARKEEKDLMMRDSTPMERSHKEKAKARRVVTPRENPTERSQSASRRVATMVRTQPERPRSSPRKERNPRKEETRMVTSQPRKTKISSGDLCLPWLACHRPSLASHHPCLLLSWISFLSWRAPWPLWLASHHRRHPSACALASLRRILPRSHHPSCLCLFFVASLHRSRIPHHQILFLLSCLCHPSWLASHHRIPRRP